MLITDESWQCKAADIAHKQRLLAVAQAAGVPMAPAAWGHATDNDLYINYWGLPTGLGVLPTPIKQGVRTTELISAYQFELMCSNYTAPTV